MLQTLSQSDNVKVAQAASQALESQPEKLKDAADAVWELDQLFAAHDELTPQSSLANLSRSKFSKVRLAVAQNIYTSEGVLEGMASQTELLHILKEVALHSNTSVSALTLLAASKIGGIKAAVAANPHTPPVVLSMLQTVPELAPIVCGNPGVATGTPEDR